MSTCSSSWRRLENAVDIPGATPRIASIGPRQADLGPSSARRSTAACSGRAVASSTQPPRRRAPAPVHVRLSARPRLGRGGARSSAHGRSLGLVGRAAIHPAELPVVRAAFLPTADEVQDMRTVLAAARGLASGHGAVAHPDGSFVDEAVVRQACSVMALAQQPT